MNHNFYLFFIVCVWSSSLLDFTQCQKHMRILGGDPDDNNDFKYQVSIQVKQKATGKYRHGCGGAIISKQHVLTASHCFKSKNGTLMNPYGGHVRIVAGTNRLDSDDGIYRFVENVYLHKNYTHVPKYALHDIAVVKLDNVLDLKDPRLSPIKLSTRPYEDLVGKVAVVSGFGVSEFLSEITENWEVTQTPLLSNTRQFLKVKILSKDDCSPYDDTICSLFHGVDLFHPHGICDGDSGGPLVYRNTVIGVVSRAAKNCDMRTARAKFILVSQYLDFIKRAVTNDDNKSDMFVIDRTTIENV